MTELPQEEQMRKLVKMDKHDSEWVTSGQITFEKFSTRYRPNTDFALKDINIHIKPGQKIGVVGRAGAGKSTLCLSICRFLEASKGRII